MFWSLSNLLLNIWIKINVLVLFLIENTLIIIKNIYPLVRRKFKQVFRRNWKKAGNEKMSLKILSLFISTDFKVCVQ